MEDIKLGKTKSANIKAIDDNFKYIDDFCVKYTENKIYVKNYIPRFADATGKIITNSNVEVDDIGIINAQGYKTIKGNEFNFVYGNNSTGRFYLNFRGADNEINYYQLCTGKGDYAKARLKLADPIDNDDAVTKNYLENVYSPSSSSTVYDFDIKYQDKRYSSGTMPSVYSALPMQERGNMFAFIPESAITYEFSTNNGNSWSTSATQKLRQAFTGVGSNNIYFIPSTAATTITKNNQMRLTVTSEAAGGWGYFELHHIYIYGTFQHDTFVKVEVLNQSNVWVTSIDSARLAGWPGPNFINVKHTFGSTHDWGNKKLRLTFTCPNISGSSTEIPRIYWIQAYGINYSRNTTFGSKDHLYDWDVDQNAYFPSKLYVSDGSNHSLVNSAFNPTQQLKAIDTRDNNFLPSEYYKSDGKRLTYEFKSTSVVGLSNLFSQEFVSLFTATPWGDSSGGRPIQIAIGQNKNNSASADFAFRNASSDSAWNSWHLDSDLKIKTISTQYIVIWNLDPGIYKLTYTGTVTIYYYSNTNNNSYKISVSGYGSLLTVSSVSSSVKVFNIQTAQNTLYYGTSTSGGGSVQIVSPKTTVESISNNITSSLLQGYNRSNYIILDLQQNDHASTLYRVKICYGVCTSTSTGAVSVSFPGTSYPYTTIPCVISTYNQRNANEVTNLYGQLTAQPTTTGCSFRCYAAHDVYWLSIGRVN